MSDDKKPFEREDDEVLAIIEEYRKKYASEGEKSDEAVPSDDKPSEAPKADSPIMAHFHDTAELRASSAHSTLNIEAHLTSLNVQSAGGC